MLKWKLLLLSSVCRSPDDPVVPDPETPDPDVDPDADPDADSDADPDADPDADVDADPDVDPDVDSDPAPPVSRAERRIRALDDRVKNLAADNARITRELEQSRRAAPISEDPRIEADRLALLSPEERIQHGVDKALARHAAQTQALTAQVMDQSDRVAFEARQSADPLAKKLAPEVERRLAEVRASGQNIPRQTVYTYLVGERVLAQQAKSKKPAAERVRRETVRPASARGDVGNSRERRGGNTVADIERNFGDVAI